MVAKEVKLFAELAREGAEIMLRRAETAIESAGGFSPDIAVALPGTRYRLPLIYALTGHEVDNLEDLEAPLDLAASLIGPSPKDEPWLPYLGTALDAGISAAISAEVACALEIDAPKPGYLWFPSDDWVKERLSRFIGSEDASFVLALGDPGERSEAVLAEFAARDILILTSGSSLAPRATFGEGGSASEGGVDPPPARIAAFTEDPAGHAFAFGALARLALMEGVEPGDHRAVLDFCRRNLFGFVALFDESDPISWAFASAGISFGLATIAREYTPQLLPIYSVPRF